MVLQSSSSALEFWLCETAVRPTLKQQVNLVTSLLAHRFQRLANVWSLWLFFFLNSQCEEQTNIYFTDAILCYTLKPGQTSGLANHANEVIIKMIKTLYTEMNAK